MSTKINRKVLEQVIAETSEPLLLVRADHPEWPIVLVNAAFEAVTKEKVLQQPFADVMESLAGRELAVEVSESIRAQQETSFPVELAGREYLLSLKPLLLAGDDSARFYAAFWRTGVGPTSGSDIHSALLRAKRRIRDLSRDDAVTGLLNERAFRDVFDHDWAVASREKSSLAVVAFTLDEFTAYVDVFGRHAADSALRRVGQAIQRCLRRASDVVARGSDNSFLVLSHAADENNVMEFAAKISAAVRELGLHHPRSSNSRFVTVSYEVAAAEPATDERDAEAFITELLRASAS
jgi:diguanylate cyclase (GGDEF)-like protein